MFIRKLFASGHRKCRAARPALEPLEPRLAMAAPAHSAGNDSYEVYAWALINEMRKNPATFGKTITKVYNKQITQAYGLRADDPVWDDLRSVIKDRDGKRDGNGGVWRFGEWSQFLTTQNYALGPLALQEDLSKGAYIHTGWMTTHAYAHSIDKSDPASAAREIRRLDGFTTGGINGQPDRVVLSSSYDGSWGEDIGAQSRATLATYQAWKAGKVSEAGYYQRAVFYDTMAYLIDWGNGAYTDGAGKFHPAYGHLRNLLSDDRTGIRASSVSTTAKNKDIGLLNAIGIDYYFYQNGDFNPNDSLAGAWASTHRLARSKDASKETGGYIVAFNYTDRNGDGFYTPGIGEGSALTYEYSYHVGMLGIGGSIYMPPNATNNGLATLDGDPFPSTTVKVSLAAGKKSLGSRTYNVQNRNILATAQASPGFGLADGGTSDGGLGLTGPTDAQLTADFAEPSETQATAYDIGSFSPNLPRAPFTGLLSIHTATDQDWYRFDVAAAGRADITVGYTSAAGDLDAWLYRANPAGGLDTVATLRSSDDDESFTGGLTAGTYYLKVAGSNGARNFYNLNVGIDFAADTDPDGNTLAAATATKITGVNGDFNRRASLIPDDVDVYRVDLAAGIRLFAQTSAPAGVPRPTDTRLRIFDATGREFASGEDRPGSSYSALSFVAPSSGAYYVAVSGGGNDAYNPTTAGSGWSSQVGEYALTIRAPADTPPPARLAAAANLFAHSPEAYARFVADAYRTYLGREPDASGLTSWVDQMLARQVSDEQLEARFIASPEYIANHGGTGRDWVTGLYRDILGREPGTPEVDSWMARLAAGASAYVIANGFSASAEREGMRVRDNYVTYLGRAAGDAEVTSWVTVYATGSKTNEDIVAGFVGSPEYFRRSGKGSSLVADWIRSAYLDVLGRPASDDDVAGWVAYLG